MRKKEANEEYARLAHRYDRRYRAYSDRTHRAVLRQLGDCGDLRLVDTGCGTGLLLASLHDDFPGAWLMGVDPSPEMLANARERLQGRAVLLQGRSEALPLAGASVDLVMSASSLHRVADPAHAIGEFARVLVAGGRLLLTDWCADSLPLRCMERYLRWTGRPTRALRTEELAMLLTDAGFEINHLSRYSAGFPWEMYLVSARRPA